LGTLFFSGDANSWHPSSSLALGVGVLAAFESEMEDFVDLSGITSSPSSRQLRLWGLRPGALLASGMITEAGGVCPALLKRSLSLADRNFMGVIVEKIALSGASDAALGFRDERRNECG
jgi:hypothetical protein